LENVVSRKERLRDWHKIGNFKRRLSQLAGNLEQRHKDLRQLIRMWKTDPQTILYIRKTELGQANYVIHMSKTVK
jgi:hypothetical protein